ncbi:exonuclease subunit SbcD [Candidatus Dependentiae bacterium]|nr:MAG: exonuclease subunit SbcD [Candidatus Dependentiae bacterium]
MIRFVHTADIHFGVENYGRIDHNTGIHSRLLDFVKALDFCIEYAIEQDVDFFLFCGDAYKTHHPTQTQQKLLFECFFKLYNRGIPVVIIVGNHDHPLSFGKTHALNLFGQLPLDGFYVIEKPDTIVLKTKNGPVQIVGIPWPTRNTVALQKDSNGKMATEITTYIAQAVATIIKHKAAQLDSALPAVLAAHLTVSSGIFSGSEKRAVYGTDPVLLPSQLGVPPFDYVALGHLHRFQQLNDAMHPPIVYAGSVERIDFGERKEEKGFCLVTLKNKYTTEVDFIKTPTRPFVYLDAYLDGTLCQTTQLMKYIQKVDIDNAIVKILYHVPQGKQDAVDIGKIEMALANAWYVAGIMPVVTHDARAQRGAIKTSMDFKTALSVYFDTKPDLKNKKHDLLEKAMRLLDEAEQAHEE